MGRLRGFLPKHTSRTMNKKLVENMYCVIPYIYIYVKPDKTNLGH